MAKKLIDSNFIFFCFQFFFYFIMLFNYLLFFILGWIPNFSLIDIIITKKYCEKYKDTPYICSNFFGFDNILIILQCTEMEKKLIPEQFGNPMKII
jgi:hypothetical protein